MAHLLPFDLFWPVECIFILFLCSAKKNSSRERFKLLFLFLLSRQLRGGVSNAEYDQENQVKNIAEDSCIYGGKSRCWIQQKGLCNKFNHFKSKFKVRFIYKCKEEPTNLWHEDFEDALLTARERERERERERKKRERDSKRERERMCTHARTQPPWYRCLKLPSLFQPWTVRMTDLSSPHTKVEQYTRITPDLGSQHIFSPFPP